jgi:hypothetical protein
MFQGGAAPAMSDWKNLAPEGREPATWSRAHMLIGLIRVRASAMPRAMSRGPTIVLRLSGLSRLDTSI